MAKKAKGATRAIVELERAGIDYVLIEYEHNEHMEGGYALDTSEVLGVDPRIVFKTLLADVCGEPMIAVVPGSGLLSLKELAKAAGKKSASMIDPSRAEKLSGYVIGGISPLGQLRPFPVFIDDSALEHDRILVSAGKRTLSVSIAPQDLARLTKATFAPIGTEH